MLSPLLGVLVAVDMERELANFVIQHWLGVSVCQVVRQPRSVLGIESCCDLTNEQLLTIG